MSSSADHLVSVVMPAYNAAPYIGEAIRSVIGQTWPHWELIVVNDGSTDGTAEVVRSFTDPRIHMVEQTNAGVSSARNKALDEARGAFVVFLDADDRLPPNSLKARVEALLAHPHAAFADGDVLAWDHATGALGPLHRPRYTGPPFDRLMRMDPSIFFGPSWMVRRSAIGGTRLPVGMTHAEDLAFYLVLARRGDYVACGEPVLHYRRGHGSAMSDLDGLDRGYMALYHHAMALDPPATGEQLGRLWRRIRRVMTLSYLKGGRPMDALRTALRARPNAPRRP
jgi:glycosyltransferase involved in cell wall biosynthesis